MSRQGTRLGARVLVTITALAAYAAVLPAPGDTTIFRAPKCQGEIATIFAGSDGKLIGTAGADVIDGSPAGDEIIGRGGNDLICGDGGPDRIFAGPGRDEVLAGAGNDGVDGGAGEDTIDGEEGDDVIDDPRGDRTDDFHVGGPGDDLLEGGGGDDTLNGEAGSDRLRGGTGADGLRGAAGPDFLHGADGEDRLAGGAAGDRLLGQDGADKIIGGNGPDQIEAGKGNDREVGGNLGHDKIEGGAGNDVLAGDSGNDHLFGQAGADRLSGDEEIDRCSGGAGQDFCNGGDPSPADPADDPDICRPDIETKRDCKMNSFPRTWSGEASGTIFNNGITQSWTASYTMHRSYQDENVADYGYSVPGRVAFSGTIYVQVSGTDSSGCSYSGGGSVPVGKAQLSLNEPFYSHALSSRYPETVPINKSCPPGQYSGPTTFLPFNCDCANTGAPPSYVGDPTTLTGQRSYSPSDSSDTAVSWTWTLTAQGNG